MALFGEGSENPTWNVTNFPVFQPAGSQLKSQTASENTAASSAGNDGAVELLDTVIKQGSR